MTPRMVEAATHPNIRLEVYSELEKVEGYVGNFKATIRRKARSVDWVKCTGCGTCYQNAHRRSSRANLMKGWAIARPSASPSRRPCHKPFIDRANCTSIQETAVRCVSETLPDRSG